MKNYAIILSFLLSNNLTSAAQSYYDNRSYNDPQYPEMGQIRRICPCEAMRYFSSRQDILSHRPVIISQNCPQSTLLFSNINSNNSNKASEGFTFADFFKLFKRKHKVTYPKGSHIIPLASH